QLAGDGETLDIFHERAGIVHLRAGVRITEQAAEGGTGLALVGIHPVGQSKDGGQYFRRRMQSAGILLLNRVPRVFVMIDAVTAAIRPVNRLVQMPEPGRVNPCVGVRLDTSWQEYDGNTPWGDTARQLHL